MLGQDVTVNLPGRSRPDRRASQKPPSLRQVTPLQNLRFAAALYGIPVRTLITESWSWWASTRGGKTSCADSPGMKRRTTAIARALLHDPQLLCILDEPTVVVDVEAGIQIWAHVRSLRAVGRTFVLTTNYLDEAEALCDRVAILRAGGCCRGHLGGARGGVWSWSAGGEGAAPDQRTAPGHRGVLQAEIVDFGLRLYLAVSVPKTSCAGARGLRHRGIHALPTLSRCSAP